MFIAGNHRCLCIDSCWFFPLILNSGKIELSITLAGVIPDNTSRFFETLCSGVELHALFTSCWEVSPIEDYLALLLVGKYHQLNCVLLVAKYHQLNYLLLVGKYHQ